MPGAHRGHNWNISKSVTAKRAFLLEDIMIFFNFYLCIFRSIIWSPKTSVLSKESFEGGSGEEKIQKHRTTRATIKCNSMQLK
jgi:hypothetical protein